MSALGFRILTALDGKSNNIDNFGVEKKTHTTPKYCCLFIIMYFCEAMITFVITVQRLLLGLLMAWLFVAAQKERL